MKLIVPTNWDDALIERLRDYPVSEFYGKLQADFFGGGRPAYSIPAAAKRSLKKHLNLVHGRGLTFNYLLNTSCMGNKEFTRWGQKKMQAFLGFLSTCGVDRVTVTSPYLLKWLKNNFPEFKVTASVMAHIDSIKKFIYWKELGADNIVLAYDANRNFEFLRQLGRPEFKDVTVLVNLACLADCPFIYLHENTSSHASSRHDPLGNFCVDYYFMACAYLRLCDPVRFIQSPWIRPEDISFYENMGINTFKVSGRTFSSGTIHRVVKAYAEGKFEGNLLDILDPYAEKTPLDKKKLFSFFKYLFRPQQANVLSFYKMRKIMGPTGIHLNNQKLSEFLDGLAKRNCPNLRCNECLYCASIAKSSINIDSDIYQEKKKAYNDILASLESGSFF